MGFQPIVHLLFWDKMLCKLVPECLTFMGMQNHRLLDGRVRSLTDDFLNELSTADILITEAYNHTRSPMDAEGFRLARIIYNSNLQLKPLVVFRRLETELLKFPCFIDYKSFHELGGRMSHLLSCETIGGDPYGKAVERMPELNQICNNGHGEV